MSTPLSETSPFSLEEIFSTAPLDRTDEEWKRVVEALHDLRRKWQEAEAAGKRSLPKKSPLKPVPQELTLDDLDL